MIIDPVGTTPSLPPPHAFSLQARPVFYRETAALFYSPWIYSPAVLIAEVPWLVAASIIGPTCSYFMIGLSSDITKFFTHFVACYIAGAAGGEKEELTLGRPSPAVQSLRTVFSRWLRLMRCRRRSSRRCDRCCLNVGGVGGSVKIHELGRAPDSCQ